MSETYKATDRIKERFGAQVGDALIGALNRARNGVDVEAVAALIASGARTDTIIQQVLATADLSAIVGRDRALLNALTETVRAAGQANITVIEEALGVALGFDYSDPLAVEAAQEQVGLLVRQIGPEQLQAIRNAVELGQSAGLTTVQQARLIREAVGLPSNWAQAPGNLAEELRAGDLSVLRRRLPANVKQQIASRIAAGTITEEFIAEVQAIYTRSLINRRAQNIARTETATAAHEGQQRAWQTAIDEGLLPQTTRRYWIVTPDDRLRTSHAQIVVLNPGGVRIGEPFQTPFGPRLHPPAEPNCRCGVGLLLQGGRVL